MPSRLLTVRQTACVESCLPICWGTFIQWKNPQCSSRLPSPFGRHQTVPPNIKCIVPAFLGNRFGGKEGGLRTLSSIQELGDKIDFCIQHLVTLNSKKILKTEIQKLKKNLSQFENLTKAYPMVSVLGRSLTVEAHRSVIVHFQWRPTR